jgi:glycosyltransferase involved in cell wall biosynthesis
MPTVKISIIVPVYNVEQYLDKCVQSLIRQTYPHIEIILVDDGSTDQCPALCDEYRKQDDRIKVIHKSNGGLSEARNFGLSAATGEFILFVDSDDYIEEDSCLRFIEAMNGQKRDIVVGNAKIFNNRKIKLMKHSYITKGICVTGPDYLEMELKNGTMYMAACLNLYNRIFLDKYNLKFKAGLLHEDEHFTPRVFLKAKQVIGTDILFYNYVIRNNSITTQKNKVKNAEDLIQTCKELEQVYDQIDDNTLKKLLKNDLVDKYLYMFQVAELYKKDYSYLIDKQFLRGKAYTKRNKAKVCLFLFNKHLYYLINKILKSIKKGRNNAACG